MGTDGKPGGKLEDLGERSPEPQSAGLDFHDGDERGRHDGGAAASLRQPHQQVVGFVAVGGEDRRLDFSQRRVARQRKEAVAACEHAAHV